VAVVRRIRADEWAKLRDIRLQLLADVPWRAKQLAVERAYTRAEWDERARVAAAAADRAGFVSEEGGDWVGIVEAAITEDPATAEIEGFWVSPAWRRRGVGAALLAAAGEWARVRRFVRLASWVRQENRPAIAAHARGGFAATGEVIRWPVRSDWQIRMVRDLSMAARSLDLLYVGTLPPHHGGSAIAMAQILKGLAERGHRVRAVGPTTEEELQRGDRFAERNPELNVERFVMPYLDRSPDVPNSAEYHERKRMQIAEVMTRLIGERRPDLAIAGRESFLWHVPDVAFAHGVPVVAFAHGSLTHGLVNGTYPRELGDELVARFCRVQLAVSPARHMAENLSRLGVPGVRVIPNPVDLTRFRPATRDPALARELAIAEDDVVVAHLSNMTAVKRPLDVVAAAVRALAREPRLLFLIVGDGPLRADAEEACRRAGISARFRFVDWVDHDEVPAYLGVADIVVQPSQDEGQALIYLETQASGRTLIASDIPAVREVAVDGETALFFPVGDVDALAAMIVRAAAQPELRNALGRAAQVYVQAHAIDDVVSAHEELLGSVAAVVAR
jgi:glycosyltransferase involved in cell wall biosynthesis/GNAT superfamily N-acetyltransferase